MLRNILLVASLSLPAITAIHAQAPETQAFAVVSVKPSAAENTHYSAGFNRGTATFVNISIPELIRFTFDLSSNEQILGLPDWAQTARFDIKGKEEESFTQRSEQAKPDVRSQMMHAAITIEILQDRFHLKETLSTRTLPVLALVQAKSGTKVTLAGSNDNKSFRGLQGNGDGHLQAYGASMALFVKNLAYKPEAQGRPVIDQTNLSGEYSWKLDWTPENLAAANTDNSNPSLFTALEEQLGLRLIPTKAPVSAILVEQIAKPSPD